MDEDRNDEVSPEEVKKVVVTAFLDHWEQLRERLVVGEDLATARADRFLAGSPQARLRIARRFYSAEHAGRLAALAESEVRELLEPWLKIAIDYYRLQAEVERQDVLSRLRTCPTSEYLMVVERYAGGLLVDRYPGDDSFYDDVYERTAAGCSSGGIVRVFKSTGEAFTLGERRSAEAGIKREFAIGYADAGDDEPWVCSVWGTVDDREVAVCIEEDHEEPP